MDENDVSKADSRTFEFQNWPVYRQSVDLVRMGHNIAAQLRRQGTRSIADQLRRASESIPLNIAEGSSRYSRADKLNYLRVARGSVFECAAIIDVLRTMSNAPMAKLDHFEKSLGNVARMLSGFIRYLRTHDATPRKG
jgi:four helix bundle protein